MKLEIKNVSKSFGEQEVLKGLSLTIDSGQIHTLVGGNGTGKTTLFNIITGFITADAGEIWLNDKRLNHSSPNAINARGITRTFQDLRIITKLTIKENILLSFKNNPGEKVLNSILPQFFFKEAYEEFSERANQIINKIHLEGVKENPASDISYGQQKLLTLGCCLANDADLLLLDEPVAGIDKENYQRIFDLITELKKDGKTILQIEHNHGFVESLTDAIWFLFDGKAYFFQNYYDFKNDEKVKSAYLHEC